MTENWHRLAILVSLFISALLFPSDTIAWENPGWGNAAKVCETPRIGGDSPDLNFKGAKNSFETGFYNIRQIPDLQNRILGATKGATDIRLLPDDYKNNQVDWLVTAVGADLYQVSICARGEPKCLTVNEDRELELGNCEHQAFGTQVWWNVGILFGPAKDGWELGSDGIGRTECLTENLNTSILSLTPCDSSGKPNVAWALTPISKQASFFPENVKTYKYRCESGENVTTFYDAEKDQMLVSYKDENVTLNAAISGSGAKFSDKSHPWGWWTKGDKGLIFASDNDEKIIEQCTEVQTSNADTPQANAENPISDRQWAATGIDSNIVLTDCRDCGDDIGIMLACQGASKPALLSLNWVASEAELTNALITFEIDEHILKRNVSTRYNGQLGHVPQLYVEPNDPIVTAFKNGKSVKITFANVTSSIGLSGSSFAFQIFDAHCKWGHNVQNTGKNGNATWYLSTYVDEGTGKEISDLIYGVPETDDVAMTASCQSNPEMADVNMLMDTGTQQDGELTHVRFETDTYSETFEGRVFSNNEEFSGVNLTIPLGNQIWLVLGSGAPFRVFPQSGKAFILSNSTENNLIKEWLSKCR